MRDYNGEYTGLRDKNGFPIMVGDRLSLMVDGEKRIFTVKKKTVIRAVKSHPHFCGPFSKVAITGYVFTWNGYDLFPCINEQGVADNDMMELIMEDTLC